VVKEKERERQEEKLRENLLKSVEKQKKEIKKTEAQKRENNLIGKYINIFIHIITMNIFRRLPKEIIREHILPYSYCPQSDSLCKDINTFYTTKRIVKELYETIYADFIDTEDDPMNWLDNDITRFMNNDIATMNGYTHRYLDIWSRLYYFSDKSDEVIQTITSHIDHRGNVKTNINIKLGLMNNKERRMLMTFLYSIWNKN
jgi:hypothetical protein